jgi:hypothetical protein
VVAPSSKNLKVKIGGRSEKTVESPALAIIRGAIAVWGILVPGFRIR